MFLYRVKVEELDCPHIDRLKSSLSREEEALCANFPIREMSVIEEQEVPELDIYLAIDDAAGRDRLRRLSDEIHAMIDEYAQDARVSDELIHV